jgi:hypothetical protein
MRDEGRDQYQAYGSGGGGVSACDIRIAFYLHKWAECPNIGTRLSSTRGGCATHTRVCQDAMRSMRDAVADGGAARRRYP